MDVRWNWSSVSVQYLRSTPLNSITALGVMFCSLFEGDLMLTFTYFFFSGKSATQPKMRWIGKLEMEKKIGERLTDKEVSVSFVCLVWLQKKEKSAIVDEKVNTAEALSRSDCRNLFAGSLLILFRHFVWLLQYDVITHRLKKLASHPNASRVTPFLLQFLHVIAIQGMRAVERKVLNVYKNIIHNFKSHKI